MSKKITEQDFMDARWDCDCCPIYPCKGCGFMLTEDCYDDVMKFWKKSGIIPTYGFSQSLEMRHEQKGHNNRT